jgi:hypothetical protein
VNKQLSSTSVRGRNNPGYAEPQQLFPKKCLGSLWNTSMALTEVSLYYPSPTHSHHQVDSFRHPSLGHPENVSASGSWCWSWSSSPTPSSQLDPASSWLVNNTKNMHGWLYASAQSSVSPLNNPLSSLVFHSTNERLRLGVFLFKFIDLVSRGIWR